MPTNYSRQVLGVLGGVGPLASAEFLKTIYEQSHARREQEMPLVWMYSDPTFPDRTEAYLSGADEELRRRLRQALGALRAQDVTCVVICCMTMHYLLPQLPAEERELIISLPELILTRLAQSTEPHIVLCTTGTRKSEVFQHQPRWAAVSQQMIFPDDEDQRLVHEFIYHVKQNGAVSLGLALLERLAEKYGATSFISGCTEFHLLTKWYQSTHAQQPRFNFLDPLTMIAQSLAQGGIR